MPPQDVEKGKEEKGKEVSVDREEEAETKVRFNLHFICFITRALLVEKWMLKVKYDMFLSQINDIHLNNDILRIIDF